MSDYDYTSSDFLPYPKCGYCGKVVRSSMAQMKGIPYHILVDENGKFCEPTDSCLGKQKTVDEIKAKYPSQDIL
jgi:hypothetical protein